MTRIYLDNNATTGIDPRVLEAILPHLSPTPENPSSIHSFGQGAKKALVQARQTIATHLHVAPQELIFTSGGTEAMNMLLRGLNLPPHKRHIISSDIEHSSLFYTLQELQKQGIEVTYLPTGAWGALRPEELQQALRPHTGCIALGAVNNETGVKAPIEEIGEIAQKVGIPLLIDAVAWLGKEPFVIPAGVSALALSGHKIHAPKGIGLAVVRPSLHLTPLLTGGSQEQGRRAGTENLAAIVGFAKAIELLAEELPNATRRMQRLRDRLENGLKEALGTTLLVNGEGPRIANTCNLSFIGMGGEDLLMQLDLCGIAVSHGSACASGALEPSRVLLNMGLGRERARSALRFSLSRWTTEEEIEKTIEMISKIRRSIAD